jgi:hypothetical protein
MEPIYRVLALAKGRGDLGWSETDDVTQNDHLTLRAGEKVKRRAEVIALVAAGLLSSRILDHDIFARDRFLGSRSEMVESGISRNTQDPCRKRDVTNLITTDCRDQLGKDILGDVFRVMRILNDASDAPQNFE